MTLTKNEIILKKKDFKNIYCKNNYKNLYSKYLVLIIKNNNYNKKRIVISIKKKITNYVNRNKMKRLIKEIFRTNKYNLFLNSYYDIIILPIINFSKENFKILENIFQFMHKKSLFINILFIKLFYYINLLKINF